MPKANGIAEKGACIGRIIRVLLAMVDPMEDLILVTRATRMQIAI
jgi:hypothetical protein